ncbi:MAG: division/cell wall cluster transcriptional repressor MraZ [Desulfurivibrionaceae bacterium]
MESALIRGAVHNFRGRSEHNLDDKGRLNIPTRFRDVLRRQYKDNLLMVSPWQNCLKAYPMAQWEKLELNLLDTSKKQPEIIKMVRYIVGGVVECPLDKQGRILLPGKMRTDCGVDREILVSGMISYFEIWDKKTWETENQPSAEDFRSFELNLLEIGLF